MLFPAVPGMTQFHDPRVPQKTLEISGILVKSQKIQQAFSLQVSPEKKSTILLSIILVV